MLVVLIWFVKFENAKNILPVVSRVAEPLSKCTILGALNVLAGLTRVGVTPGGVAETLSSRVWFCALLRMHLIVLH